MKTLQNITPTPEQLSLITHPKLGIRIIRGAAGSGKTTTSILMMKTAIGYVIDHFLSTGNSSQVKLRVFTFNRTLAAYVNDLVSEMAANFENIEEMLDIEITTLGKYFYNRISSPRIIQDKIKDQFLTQSGAKVPLSSAFIIDEVDYILGRLPPDKYEEYIDIERTGRGNKPRVDKAIRRQLLDYVVYPYQKYKESTGFVDWHDLAHYFSTNKIEDIDIAIVDEAQDFSSIQLKAIVNQLSPETYTTIVLDSAQQIYKRSYTWKEIGITGASYSRLECNYRNTYEIALFAHNLLQSANVALDENATLPKLESITKHGNKPLLVKGEFPAQIKFILSFIHKYVDLANDTVGFLHPKGGRWFDYLKEKLDEEGLDYVEIARKNYWPKADTNIALSTIHSAKGLEFDYVFIVGAQDSHFVFESLDHEDANYASAIRLFSMGITRAKNNVIISCKNETTPCFFKHLDANTYEEIVL
ncbi:AAA family ATPase [Vibrio parahaemolyticus]|nr:AAA family ATPase [Vibrio parahaemolyticus]HCG6900128.1 AAA family ATPase [Vibrio parahaemolyticus]